jgi:hypothetical protein
MTDLKMTKFMITFSVLLAPSNLFGLLISLFISFVPQNRKIILTPLVCSLALFLASINATKKLQGDLANYFYFSEELAGVGFSALIAQFGKEPLYYLWNWLHVSVFRFTWESWVFTFSAVFYLIYLATLVRVLDELKFSKHLRILSIILAAFFPLVFMQSAHLVRQYLAGTFILLGVVNFIFNKRALPFFLIAITFHVSAVIFLIIPTLSKFNFRSKLKIFLMTFWAPLVFLLLINLISKYGIDEYLPLLMQYGIQRLTQTEFYQLQPLSLFSITFILLMFIMSSFIVLKKQKTNYEDTTYLRIIISYSFFTFLSIVVLYFHFVGRPELSLRFMQYLVLFFPITFVLCAHFFPFLKQFLLISGLIMPIVFCVYPSNWQYSNLLELLTYPYAFFLY